MRRLGWAFVALVLVCTVLLAPLWPGLRGVPPTDGSPSPAATVTPAPSATPALPARTTPYRAVWVSYLEWQQLDFSSADAFSRGIDALLDNIAALGATVVLAQVRPFGDALYPSTLFPFSHLCTGVQGQDPGFDPLALLVEAAHARGLELEAWINPYRLQAGSVPALCDESPAVQHPDWTKATDTGLYLDPANPDVQQYIADGIRELCQNYPLDGIHLDDYFYPTTSATFDAAEYAAAGTGLEGKISITPSAPVGNEWSNNLRNGTMDTQLAGWSSTVALDPFSLADVWTDVDQAYWGQWYNADDYDMTLTIGGTELTMSVRDWALCLNGTMVTVDGVDYNFGYGQADVEDRLTILAAIERHMLTSYNCVPILQDGGGSLLSQQMYYVVEEYNPILERGGIQYLKYNYDDAEWAAFVAEQGGILQY